MKIKSILLFIGAIVVLPFCSCSKAQVEDKVYQPRTELGQTILSKSGVVHRVFKDTTFVVALGVDETDVHFQTMDGYIEKIFVLRVDTKVQGVRLKVSMPNNSNDHSAGWNKQTLTDMAKYMSKPGARVVGMVNGDFWATATPIRPRGPIHRAGVVVNDEFYYQETLPQQALSFIAVKDDGSMIIADKSLYSEMKSHLMECTGAGLVLLQDGNFPGTDWTGLDPRTAIGYTEDGVVYLLTGDGRQTMGAVGLTYKTMAYLFKSLGCVGAANLDGGGSAQMLIKNPIAHVYQIRNTPADGAERPVINGWAVVVDEP